MRISIRWLHYSIIFIGFIFISGSRCGPTPPKENTTSVLLTANWKVECANPTGSSLCKSFQMPGHCWSGTIKTSTGSEGISRFEEKCAQSELISNPPTNFRNSTTISGLKFGTWDITYQDSAGNLTKCSVDAKSSQGIVNVFEGRTCKSGW